MNSSRKTAINWLLGVLLSIFAATAFAADCKVNDSDISGEYVGDCVNGLAHGKGRGKGRDTYEGEFKQGNKHGYGKYVWPVGPIYQGSYFDDRRNGFGALTIPRSVYDENKFHSKGKWIGDSYVETGMFERGNFIFSCTSSQNCKQEQAKREAQERREAADREASTRQACSRLYIGKPVSWPEGRTCVLTGCDNFTLHGQIVGVGNGVASAKVTESYKYGQVHEKACNEF